MKYTNCSVEGDACGHEFLCGMCRGENQDKDRHGDDLRQACKDLVHCKESSNQYFKGHKYQGYIHVWEVLEVIEKGDVRQQRNYRTGKRVGK